MLIRIDIRNGELGSSVASDGSRFDGSEMATFLLFVSLFSVAFI